MELLRKDIKLDRREVIPVAALARKFAVSPRLLWNWIQDGLLSKAPRNIPLGKKPGVTKSAVRSFLKRLARAKTFCYEDGSVWSRGGRPDTAQKKIRQALRSGIDGQGMNPREFAEAASVSRSAVWRAMKSGKLPSFKPSPHRTLVGKRPNEIKKNRSKRKKFA